MFVVLGAQQSEAGYNYVVNMQRQSFKVEGSVEDAFTAAIHLAQIYIPLFTSVTMIAVPSLLVLVSFFEGCQILFVRGEAEKRACQSAQSFAGFPESRLEEAKSMLTNNFGGSLTDMITAFQGAGTESRFNEQRCQNMFAGDPEF